MKVTPRPLERSETEYLKAFQEMLEVILTYFSESEHFKGNLDDLKAAINRFSNYPFASKLIDTVNSMNNEFDTIQQAKTQPDNLDLIVQTTKQLEAQFLKGKFDNSLVAKLNQLLTAANTRNKNVDDELGKYKNPMKIEDPLFFGTDNFIRSLSENNMKDIVRTNVEGKYTFLDVPYTDTNFQYMVFFFNNLKDNDEPIELSAHQADKVIRYENRNNAEFDELMGLVKRFLISNERAVLPEILKMLNKFPKLKALNQKAKVDRTVYRGIKHREGADGESLGYDHDMAMEQRYVSTSTDRDVALRFALGIGHLESLKSARTDGTLITYRVPFDAIVLDTMIFGGKYLESELIIDALKSEVTDLKEVYMDDYREEY